jgi:hypothetical protein
MFFINGVITPHIEYKIYCFVQASKFFTFCYKFKLFKEI